MAAHMILEQRRIAVLFRTGLGLVFLAAFLSLSVQLADLIGPRGLLPLHDFLGRLAAAKPGWFARFHTFPTLFLWLDPGNAALTGVTLAGAAISLLMIAGIGGRLVTFALWFLYLSCITAGRDFFYYQWDNLLLETGLLAIFLPPRGSVAGLVQGRSQPRPSPVVVLLLRWVLFRLLFESGLAKLYAGEGTWLDLSAMTYYYETAPLPSLGGWFVQQFPRWFHELSVLFTFLVELLLAVFIFLPRRFRIAFFLAHIPFQVSIGLTSNYGFFNLLSLVLSLLVLEDRDLDAAARRIAGLLRRGPSGATVGTVAMDTGVAGPPRHRRLAWLQSLARIAPWALAAFIVPASLAEGWTYFFRDPIQHAQLAPFRSLYAPYRSVHVYHLFPGVVRERIVAEIEGSEDGVAWEPFYLRYAPGDPEAPPPMTWLHNPRFPFTWSFLTLGRGRRDEDYLQGLVALLCCDPQAVSDLILPNRFIASRPAALRMSYYRYHFGTYQDLKRTGNYWIREPIGQPSRTVRCTCPR
jgi:lipase maturation factor 1